MTKLYHYVVSRIYKVVNLKGETINQPIHASGDEILVCTWDSFKYSVYYSDAWSKSGQDNWVSIALKAYIHWIANQITYEDLEDYFTEHQIMDLLQEVDK